MGHPRCPWHPRGVGTHASTCTRRMRYSPSWRMGHSTPWCMWHSSSSCSPTWCVWHARSMWHTGGMRHAISWRMWHSWGWRVITTWMHRPCWRAIARYRCWWSVVWSTGMWGAWMWSARMLCTGKRCLRVGCTRMWTWPWVGSSWSWSPRSHMSHIWMSLLITLQIHLQNKRVIQKWYRNAIMECYHVWVLFFYIGSSCGYNLS